MPDSYTIRPARPEEAAVLTDLAHAAKRYWGYSEAHIELWRDDLTITAHDIETSPVYVVASASDEPVGVYGLSVDGSGFELEHFWVRPDHIGHGLGSRMFEHLHAWIAAQQGTHLRIVADPNAVGFYSAMGAQLVGEVAGYPVGRRLPLLSLPLTPTEHEHERKL